MHQYNEVAARDYVYDGRYGFAPSLAFGLGTPTRVTLSYLQQRESDLPDYGFPFINANAVKSGTYPQSMLNQVAPLPYNNWYGMLYRDIEVSTTSMPTLNIEHDFDSGAKLISETRYDRTNFYSFNTSARYDSSSPATVNQITQEPSARSELDELIDSKLYATIPFETWKIPHDLVASLEYSHESDIYSTGAPPSTSLYPLTNMFTPNPYATYNGPMTWTNPTTNQLSDLAVSLFDTIKFTPQWELTGGARFDHLDTTSVNPAISTARYAQIENLASWRLALVYKPLPNGSIYAGYGTSFNPSIQGISDGASNDGFTANTANIPPEEDISYEIGTKWDLLDQKLTVTGALFRTDKTHTRETDPTSPTTVYILSGVQRVQGAEVDVAGSLTNEWKVFGGYAFMPSKVISGPSNAYPGNALPNAPEQSASIWSTYDLPSHFTIGTGFNYMDARYSAVNNLNCSPGYWTQQAMLAYRFNKNVDVQLNVYNLWNEQYIDLVGAHQVVPGAGRTFVVTTSLKF
jgi:catecholate siderophore receptor